METNHYIVTGGTGLLGRPLVDELIGGGHEVTVVGRRRPFHPDAMSAHSDLLASGDVFRQSLPSMKGHILIHAGWDTTPGTYHTGDINERWKLASTRLIDEAIAQGIDRIVGIGTCLEYASCDGPIPESHAINPRTPYAAAKNDVRRMLEETATAAGVPWLWGRIFYLYGPREDSRRLIPSLVSDRKANRPTKCSHGTQMRDFIRNDRAAALISKLASNQGIGCVNVGTGQGLQVRDVIVAVLEQLPAGPSPEFGAREVGPGEDDTIIADTRRAMDLARWTPPADALDDIRGAAQWWAQEVFGR